MEKEVEAWDSALFTCAIRKYTVHLDRENRFFFKFHITSGMFLRLSLMRMDDIR